MNLDIVPAGPIDLEMMRDLGELHDELRAADLPAERATAAVPGTKDAGLTVAIAVGGLAMSAISSIVSVLTYWSSRKPRYAVTIETGRVKLEATGLDRAGVQALLRDLHEEQDAAGALVRVRLK